MMATTDESWDQLAVSIPKALRHRLKLHCVMQDVSITELATAAIAEKLRREPEPGKKKRTA